MRHNIFSVMFAWYFFFSAYQYGSSMVGPFGNRTECEKVRVQIMAKSMDKQTPRMTGMILTDCQSSEPTAFNK